MATKLIVAIGFLVAFSAGLVVGIKQRPSGGVSSVSPTTGPTTRQGGFRGPRGFLHRELNLTAEQQEQMKQIWSQVASRGGREQDEQRRQYRKERDEALLALVREEDRAAYDAIIQKYQGRIASMEQEFRETFERAVKQTEAILTPEQRVKYEEIRRRNQQWDGERGPRGGRGRNGDDDRSRDSRDEDKDRGPDRATSGDSVE